MNTVKTIYVITSGEYSDYRVNAIYSTLKAAKAYKRVHDRVGVYGCEHSIEEWALNQPLIVNGLSTYDCMLTKNKLEGEYLHTTVREDDTLDQDVRVSDERGYLVMETDVRAGSHAAAEKIARDRFAQKRAEMEGIA